MAVILVFSISIFSSLWPPELVGELLREKTIPHATHD